MDKETKTNKASGKITPAMLILAVVMTFMPLALVVRLASAEGPTWWTTRQVLNHAATTNDFAPVNMGQLKWIATNAMAEMDEHLSGGAGWRVQGVVNSYWLDDNVNYAAVNIGQVKNLASVFYDRLIEVGYTNAYPWPTNAPCNDYAVANMGQVKALFDFDFEGKFAVYSGTFSYSGVQTGGTFRIFATTNAGGWFDSQSNFNYNCVNPLDAMVNLTESGEFAVTSTLYAVNWFCAWLDADSDVTFDTGEPFLLSNPGGTWVTGNLTGQVVVLQDPIIATFASPELAMFTNRTSPYSDNNGQSASVQIIATATNSVYTNVFEQLVIESQNNGIVQMSGTSTNGNTVSYNLQSGAAGSTYIQARLGNSVLASQLVHSAQASWSESVVRIATSAPPNLCGWDWADVTPTYTVATESQTVALTVTPTNALPFFTISNSAPEVCDMTPLAGNTGAVVTAREPGGASISALLGGAVGVSFSSDVVRVCFWAKEMGILTNETRMVGLSVEPWYRWATVWFRTNTANVARLDWTDSFGNLMVRGLTNGTCYFDVGYGTVVVDRIKIVVHDLIPETTNLVMALDPTTPSAVYDWCKVYVGGEDPILDWSWVQRLVGTPTELGILLETQPPGLVTAELITNALPAPHIQLLVRPASTNGGTAEIVMRLNPTWENGWASNVFAMVVANVVKARPFMNMKYAPKEGPCTLTLTEANAPRGGWWSERDIPWEWLCDPWYNWWFWTTYPYANWSGREYSPQWPYYVEAVECRWVIEKQWCFLNYWWDWEWNEPDLNARYNPTCMVYFCDFAFTNSPYTALNATYGTPFRPVSYLPTNAPANPTDSVFTLRYVGGTGAVAIDVDSERHCFSGYPWFTNAVTMTDHLDATTDPDFWPLGAKVWTLPGEIRGFAEGQVDLEYLITNQYGIIASNVISLYVVKVDLDVDTDRDGTIEDDDETDEDTWSLSRGAFAIPSHFEYEGMPYNPNGLPSLVIRPIPGVPSNCWLQIENVTPANLASDLMILDAASNRIVCSASSTYRLPCTLPLTSNITYSVAINRGREGTIGVNAFEYLVRLNIFDGDNNLLGNDTVRLKLAPLILPTEYDPVEAVYTVANTLMASNGVIPNITPISGGEVGSFSQWAQDFAKFAKAQYNTGNSVDVLVDLRADDPPSGDYPLNLAANTGTMRRVEWWGGNGGNIMVTPPLSDAPYGKVIVGSKCADSVPYVQAQAIQTNVITSINTDWLVVGHVDEVIMFTSSSTVLIPDPWTAANIMHNAIVAGNGTNTIRYGATTNDTWATSARSFIDLTVATNAVGAYKTNSLPTPGLSATTTNTTLTFATHNFATGDFLRVDNEILEVVAATSNTITVSRQKAGTSVAVHTTNTLFYALTDVLRWNLQIDDPCVYTNIIAVTNALTAVMGTTSPSYVKLPVLFHRILDDDNVLRFVAGTANVVNSLVYPGNGIYMQDTGNPEFNSSINSLVPNAVFLNVWNKYHCFDGEIHCGTATRRTINLTPPWWQRITVWQ
jgi:hypothetical protein